jgi:hypothetical protein
LEVSKVHKERPVYKERKVSKVAKDSLDLKA